MLASNDRRRRTPYLVAAGVTITVGLAWHLSPAVAGPDVKDVVGDALWAAMMLWIVSFLIPGRALLLRAGVALAACFAVETSQLYHAPFIDSIRSTLPGHLVLGSGFDARDLAAYTVGVVVAALLDRLIWKSSV
jgi:hypothetical protein